MRLSWAFVGIPAVALPEAPVSSQEREVQSLARPHSPTPHSLERTDIFPPRPDCIALGQYASVHLAVSRDQSMSFLPYASHLGRRASAFP